MRTVPPRIRLLGALTALVAATGAFGAQSASAASIVLTLTPDHTLEIRLDSGARIRAPGTVIAPGVYQAVVISEVPEFRDEYHMFHLVGPGVNLQTDLLAGDERAEPHTITLQPNSQYTFRDERNLGLGSVVFATSGAGTEVATTTRTNTGGSGTTAPKTTNKDLVGSKAALPLRGALAGSVSTSGKLKLTFKGKNVLSLKAGRYTISVLDETSRSAFLLQRRKQDPVTLSTKAHVGRRTRTVSLGAGQWMYYSSPGRKSYFVVTS
jgi:hypothetical protein